MNHDPAEILLMDDMFPRKLIHWTGIVRPTMAEIKEQQTDRGVMKYVIATGTVITDERTISDFELLIEILKIGYFFTNQNNTNHHGASANTGVILDFIKKHGFPFLSQELQEMPQQEQLRLKSLSTEEFLYETDGWFPHDGCDLTTFILSAKYLYCVWNTWCHIAFPSYGEDYSSKHQLLQSYIEHGNWTYSTNGSTIMHKPQLTHSLKFDPNSGKYMDYYESQNLFCIITDQLYSFIADYEAGKYSCIKECPVCGRAIKVSRNQKYCSLCSDEIKSQKSTERSKRYREKRKTATQ